ncbi:MAG TPA: TIGR02466 family protein, partial [Phenylobacterium sp.]
ELKKRLDRHAAAFAGQLAFDLGGRRPKLDSVWVNVLKPGAAHSGHIHPHSVISGTVYVATPKGSSALKLEDPRLPLMMAAPPRRADAPQAMQPFVYLQPQAGTVLMWESWLRHEVPANAARAERISISFNYSWG